MARVKMRYRERCSTSTGSSSPTAHVHRQPTTTTHSRGKGVGLSSHLHKRHGVSSLPVKSGSGLVYSSLPRPRIFLFLFSLQTRAGLSTVSTCPSPRSGLLFRRNHATRSRALQEYQPQRSIPPSAVAWPASSRVSRSTDWTLSPQFTYLDLGSQVKSTG